MAIDAMEKGHAEKPFDYYGHVAGDPEKALKQVIEPQHGDVFNSGLIHVTRDEEKNKLNVKIPPLRSLTSKPKRIASGHGACPGCGIFGGLELFFKGIEGDLLIHPISRRRSITFSKMEQQHYQGRSKHSVN
jgi:pyruvate ferredoxin oxidoreductase alpha subunit